MYYCDKRIRVANDQRPKKGDRDCQLCINVAKEEERV